MPAPCSLVRAGRTAEADDAGLTPREREILRLVAEGGTNVEVARKLWVTEQTVKFHLSNVYRKLNVSNRTEAGRWAHAHGLLGERRGSERGAGGLRTPVAGFSRRRSESGPGQGAVSSPREEKTEIVPPTAEHVLAVHPPRPLSLAPLFWT